MLKVITHQLVLQWPVTSTLSYDEIVLIEDLLIDRIDAIAQVDGHDAGSGEVNIFLLTEHPHKAFQTAKVALEEVGFLTNMKAAYRKLSEESYRPIWPSGLKTFSLK